MSGLERTFPNNATMPFVPARVRGMGAVRYRCPESGSYVLVTDPSALNVLSTRPIACPACGDKHRLMHTDNVPVDSAA
jgi:DNA-directed RNA polymerase subunit RPC12/RpoP